MSSRTTGIIIILLVFNAELVHSEGLKRGTSLCNMGDCSLKDVPLGTTIYAREPKNPKNEDPKVQAPSPLPTPSQASSAKSLPKKRNRIVQRHSPETHGVATSDISRKVKSVPGEEGNLPLFYQGLDRSSYQIAQIADTQVQKVSLKLPGLKSGDIIKAVVEQSIKASPTVPTPVRAMLVSGPYKGSFVLGQATLDRELKRVLFNFVKLRRPDTDQVYSMKAEGLSPSGQVGLEGDYESQSGKFFVGEFVAATAAGFADATTQRSMTAYGTYVTDPSLANAGKQGAVNALSKTAEHFAEQTRSAPEFTQVEGYQSIQVIFEEDPVETGS